MNFGPGPIISTGNVVGPASATDSAVALFDGSTGKLLKNSTLTVTGGASPLVTLGGATNAFPALLRSGTTLVVRLADNSADAPLLAATITGTVLTATATGSTSAPVLLFSGTGTTNSGFYADTVDGGRILVTSRGSLSLIFSGSGITAVGQLDVGTNMVAQLDVVAGRQLKTASSLVSGLPAANQFGSGGAICFVTDALAPVAGTGPVVGGGGVKGLVVSDGTNWLWVM